MEELPWKCLVDRFPLPLKLLDVHIDHANWGFARKNPFSLGATNNPCSGFFSFALPGHYLESSRPGDLVMEKQVV